MARFPEVEERVLQQQEEHKPMLEWMCVQAKQRIAKGRIVLIENGQTSHALRLRPLADMDGTPDGLMDSEFEYVVGDQCQLGQRDRESGLPFRARTAWGTNAHRLKESLGVLCDNSHEHKMCGDKRLWA